MNLKSATMIGMIGLSLAIVLRFVLLLASLLTFAVPSSGLSDLPLSFIAQTVLHFVTDLLAYGGLLVFLYVLWTKQQTTVDQAPRA